MSDDLVKRLRALKDYGTVHEAADRIEQLEARLKKTQVAHWASIWERQSDRIKELEAALREIDEACNWSRSDETCRRIARAALDGEKKDE